MYSLVYYFFYLLVFAVASIEIANNLSLSEMKRGKYIYIIVNVLMSLGVVLGNLNRTLLMVVTTIMIFGISYINFKRISYSFFIGVTTTLIISLSDALTSLLIIFVMRTDINMVNEKSLEYFFLGVFVVLTAWGISLGVKKFLYNINDKEHSINRRYEFKIPLSLYIIFIFSDMYVNLYAYEYFVGYINNRIIIINAFRTIINFSIVFMFIYINNKHINVKLEEEYRNRELKNLGDHINTLEMVLDDSKKFKHDYNNIIESMSLYIENKDMEGLEKFYKNDLLPESKNVIEKSTSIELLKNIKITSLKSLISSKIIKAQAMNIKVDMEILEEIESIDIKEFDICRIVGILLDNSIEAAALCNEKFIKFAILEERNSIIFIIKNSCIENTPPIHLIRKKGFSTKGEGRGLGLSIIDEIINSKYTNLSSNIEINDSVFTYELKIKN